jgi:hypothetical protein
MREFSCSGARTPTPPSANWIYRTRLGGSGLGPKSPKDGIGAPQPKLYRFMVFDWGRGSGYVDRPRMAAGGTCI